MQETGFSAEPSKLSSSVGDFTVENKDYYDREFVKIQSATKFPWSWNPMAAIVGPFWGAARGIWGYFWTFMVSRDSRIRTDWVKEFGVNSAPSSLSRARKDLIPRFQCPLWRNMQSRRLASGATMYAGAESIVNACRKPPEGR